MQILYCDKCGKRVPEKDLSDGAAVRVEEKVFCAACQPAPEKVASAASHPVTQSGNLKAQGSTVNIRVAGLKEASGGLAVAKAGASARGGVAKRPGSGGVSGTAEPESKNTLFVAGIGGGVVLLILAFVLLGRGGDHPATESKAGKGSGKSGDETHGKSAAPHIIPAKNDTPVKTEPRPGSTNPDPGRVMDPGGKTSDADPEKLAGDAFDVLVRFEGVGADDKDAKLKRIDAFLAKYGDTMVSVRARKLMNDLKEPPKPPEPEKKKEAAEAGPAPDFHDADEPSSAGWQTDRGPFDFESDTQEFQGDGSPLEQGTFKGRKCVKLSPGGARNECRGYRPGRTAAEGFRIKFRYYAHNLENLEVLFGVPEARPRKNINGLVQDQWAWATMTSEEIGAHGEGQHVEFGGRAKGADSFLLLDDVRWEKK
ncbi:MAG: hypothetical protein HY291_04360 [Planctomycetes bacterium]|nr:hypothetical protein [Planctomycetota bacterium]